MEGRDKPAPRRQTGMDHDRAAQRTLQERKDGTALGPFLHPAEYAALFRPTRAVNYLTWQLASDIVAVRLLEPLKTTTSSAFVSAVGFTLLISERSNPQFTLFDSLDMHSGPCQTSGLLESFGSNIFTVYEPTVNAVYGFVD